MFPGIAPSDKQAGAPSQQQSSSSPQHSPQNTRRSLNLAPASSPDKQQHAGGDQSPRGPLSVDMSEDGASRSGTVDDELARTFDLRDLESAE